MTMIDRAALLDVLKAKCRERCPDGYDPAKCRNRCDAADEIALVEDAPAVVPGCPALAQDRRRAAD